jgi:hypothetical protein
MWSTTPVVKFTQYTKEGASAVTVGQNAGRIREDKSATGTYTPDLLMAVFELAPAPADARIDIGTIVEFQFVSGLTNPDNTKPTDAWKVDFYVDNSSKGCNLKTLANL